MSRIRHLAERHHVPSGMHVVAPDPDELRTRLNEGYRFIAYSIDAVVYQQSRPVAFEDQMPEFP